MAHCFRMFWTKQRLEGDCFIWDRMIFLHVLILLSTYWRKSVINSVLQVGRYIGIRTSTYTFNYVSSYLLSLIKRRKFILDRRREKALMSAVKIQTDAAFEGKRLSEQRFLIGYKDQRRRHRAVLVVSSSVNYKLGFLNVRDDSYKGTSSTLPYPYSFSSMML